MTIYRHQPRATTSARHLAPGVGIDAHWHDEDQIIYPRSGVVEVITDAGRWVAPASRALWIPAGTGHQHRAHRHTELHLVGLPRTDRPQTDCPPIGHPLPGHPQTDHPQANHPQTGHPPSGYPQADRLPIDRSRTDHPQADCPQTGPLPTGHPQQDPSQQAVPTVVNPLSRPVVLSVTPLLRELILAYTREPHDETPERARLRAVLLDQVKIGAPEQPIHIPTPRDPRLRAVSLHLHDNPADGSTLAALGRLAGASERTLARLCSTDLGMTFPQWRTQIRLRHALLLLADGLPVTTVAHRAGWSSPSTFIHVFREAFGHTPGRAFTL